jgi:hypothetical protein
VTAFSWHDLMAIARELRPSQHSNRHLLEQLVGYLGAATTMQNQNSNLVYVVALNRETFGCGDTTFVDVVEKYGQYFHPIGGVGGGWPYDPPNYLAVRYDGELKGIYHIESYQVIDDFSPHFAAKRTPTDRPHFLCKLGPAIRPPRRVPTNGPKHTIYRAIRLWVYIELLHTSGSIAEASYLSKERERDSTYEQA